MPKAFMEIGLMMTLAEAREVQDAMDGREGVVAIDVFNALSEVFAQIEEGDCP